MRDVVIAAATRTPIGRFKGMFADVRADHLGAAVLNELLRRTGLPADLVEDVIFGCVTQIGEQCGNIARTSMLGAGWPEHIPGMTEDRKCGSAEAAIHTAYAQIAAGVIDVAAAGGAESMTRVPMGSNRDLHGKPFGWLLTDRYEMTSQGEAAERVADLWDLTRTDLDQCAVDSHARAGAAADRGWFDREIVPVRVGNFSEARDGDGEILVSKDETIRRGTNLEKLATLKTVFRADGRVTAGNSSQISDGAAALLLMAADVARLRGIVPIARIHAVAVVGSDPTLMLTGPVAAARKVLAKAGLTADDIDLFEVNEAFASVPLMWRKELGVNADRLNVNGGAVALGHPLGASGARIMTTLVHELMRRGARYGLQTICCAGGLATATIVERIG